MPKLVPRLEHPGSTCFFLPLRFGPSSRMFDLFNERAKPVPTTSHRGSSRVVARLLPYVFGSYKMYMTVLVKLRITLDAEYKSIVGIAGTGADRKDP